MAINELAAKFAKEGIVPETTVYVPILCSDTGKTFYYKFCLYSHLKPKWIMMEVCLDALPSMISSAEVNMDGYLRAEELKCPYCGTVGFGRHIACGTVYCHDFSLPNRYCPSCKRDLVSAGKIDKL